jgi:hypothetical protein
MIGCMRVLELAKFELEIAACITKGVPDASHRESPLRSVVVLVFTCLYEE